MAIVDRPSAIPLRVAAPSRRPASVVRRLRRHTSAVVGVVLLAFIALTAVFAPFLGLGDPLRQDLIDALARPSPAHPFGTDAFGRDILSRVIYGARISLTVGLLVVLIAMSVGVVLGLAAGFYGGWIDEAISRVVDVLLAFPSFLLAMAVLAMLGPSLTNAMLAVSIASIPAFTRVVRGSVLSEKSRQYIEAARALGCADFRIMLRHLLPNVMGPIVVLGTLRIGTAILTTSSLSFLGLGAQPPTPEWGAMLAMGRTYIRKAWWITLFPGAAIALSVLALNLLGDGLRDVLDPKLRRR